MLIVEILFIIVLVFVNGLLAMSELAVVSSRPARLNLLAQSGVRGAEQALALASDPGKFLSTVQIGITLVGVLSGAFSGSTSGLRLTGWLMSLGLPAQIAGALGVGAVVAVISYTTLIIGELVPKQLALGDAEAIAVRVAPAMSLLARLAAPIVWLLDASGDLVLRLLGRSEKGDETVGDEEILMLIREAEEAGTIEAEERAMIAGVMRLGDRTARALMTPRRQVDWIDVTAKEDAIRRQLLETQHTRLPACDGSIHNTIGVIQTRALLGAWAKDEPLAPRSHVRPAAIVHDVADALDVVAILKEAEVPMALVHDEYGNFEGLITPADILETIAGMFRSDRGEEEPGALQREDGSWLLAGSCPADEMADQLGVALPAHRPYDTVAGLVLSHLGHLPLVGEKVEALGWRFEVVDLDGRRIDKVIATRSGPNEA